MSYDPDCEILARHFLPDEAMPRMIKDLSQAIQDAIEDWLKFECELLDRSLPPAATNRK